MKLVVIKAIKLSTLLILFISTCSYGQKYHANNALQSLVFQFAKNQLEQQHYKDYSLKVGSLDSRMRLSVCPSDKLSLFIPHDQTIINTSTIGINCNHQPNDWKIYIPVKIKILTNVVVTKHSLARNHVISANDLQTIKMDIKKLRYGYFSQAKPIMGKVTKRTLRPGHVISPNHLQLQKLIRRGDAVTITAINQAIKVSMKGVAIENGRLGDVIRVKNLSSAKVIDAKIVSRQQVEIKI